MTPALHIDRLSAGYGSRLVLRDLGVAPIPPGAVTALVGPNGAGKSTLLRVLAGLLPGRGVVRLGSHDLLRLPLRMRAGWVSYMPQAAAQRTALSVLEGVIAALRAAPLATGTPGTDEAVRRGVAVLDQVGMRHLAHEPLDHLSGGQRQLASLAQSLVRDPQLLLLDEPTSALDLRHQAVVIDLVRRFASTGRIVVAVVHDLTLAAHWADRVIVLERGAVRAAGTPGEALTADVLAGVYGVEARIERCTRGRLQVMVDGLVVDAQHSQEEARATLR